jgi:hypothetical protein
MTEYDALVREAVHRTTLPCPLMMINSGHHSTRRMTHIEHVINADLRQHGKRLPTAESKHNGRLADCEAQEADNAGVVRLMR